MRLSRFLRSPPGDPWRVLGVPRGQITPDELRKRYLELAKQFHPDRNKNDPEAVRKFKEINEAYESIRDGRAEFEHPHFGGDGPYGGPYGGPGPGGWGPHHQNPYGPGPGGWGPGQGPGGGGPYTPRGPFYQGGQYPPPPGGGYSGGGRGAGQGSGQAGGPGGSYQYGGSSGSGSSGGPGAGGGSGSYPGGPGTHADWRARVAMEQQRRMQEEELWRRQRMSSVFNRWSGGRWFQRGGNNFNNQYNQQQQDPQDQNDFPTDPRAVDRMFVIWPIAFVVLLILRGPPDVEVFIDEKGRGVSFDGYGTPKYHPEYDVELAESVKADMRKMRKIEDDMARKAEPAVEGAPGPPPGGLLRRRPAHGMAGLVEDTPRTGMHLHRPASSTTRRERDDAEHEAK